MRIKQYILIPFVLIAMSVMGQSHVQVAQSKEDFIRVNHLEDIENIVHQFANSKTFIQFLLEQGHKIDHNDIDIKRKDVSVGEDVDIYVKHFTDHQSFTMILVPINIYSYAIYDTLLFSVLEVSDQWIKDEFWQNDMNDDSVKAHLLSLENHSLLSDHMANLAMKNTNDDITEMKVNLHESYITTSSIDLHMAELTEKEKREFRKSWGLLKKAFTHNIGLNVEMNIYVFGYDDMEVKYFSNGEYKSYQINPSNIFEHHNFVD